MRCFRLFLTVAVALAVHSAGEENRPSAVFTGRLTLVRHDMPNGLSDGYAPTRQPAKRRDGPDAIDWPDLTLNGQEIFRNGSETELPLKLRTGVQAFSPFQLPTDDIIQPGNHWLRAMEWRGGRRHIYTADKTARTSNTSAEMSGRYELWTFSVLVKGEGGPVVKNVEVRAGNTLIYKKAGPWRSLTLLLPANDPAEPYEIRVDGRAPLKFQAGLMPVKLGDPRETVFPLDATLPGGRPIIRILAPVAPDEFPNLKEWHADLAALAGPLPPAMKVNPPPPSLRRYLGVEVPRSPLKIYGIALPHGMSGGFFRKGMNLDDYASAVADLGYDVVFEQANALPAPNESTSMEQLAAALARRGVGFGLQYDNNRLRPSLQHPDVAFLAHTLPEWHAPLYRSIALAVQRFIRLPGFNGLSIGADNGGYASSWHWAPPGPDRPWGEGMIEFMRTSQPRMPRAPALGDSQLPYETSVNTMGEFLRYVERYETAFRQYGYLADAVQEIDPRLTFATGSFGSSPGAGARGGWPSASIPGRMMHEGLGTQQVYDWNKTHAAKPMHNVALVDRLRSYHPRKKTWTIIDNYQFLYGRESFQRACALALTRGVQGLGTNFLATGRDDVNAGQVGRWQKEFYTFVRKYGGVFARCEPMPFIGVFYSHHQALQRPLSTRLDEPIERLLQASHEGKVTEALFVCHAAGCPARVITFQELMRGPLPASMKAILLVGLDQADATWSWAAGLGGPLKQFIDGGGRVIADEYSVCPVPVVRANLRFAAYVPQSDFDPTPLLFARNQENIRALRGIMQDVPGPIAVSQEQTVWAIPMECGDTEYVVVVNQGFADGDEAKEMLKAADPKATRPETWKTKGNASLYVKPQMGRLQWNTGRAIYDLALGRKVDKEEASRVDLTRDAFRCYALPPADVSPPEVTVTKGVAGFFEATATMAGGGSRGGIPVEFNVSRGADSALIFSSTGLPARLPLSEGDAPGEYLVTARELLSGLSQSTHVTIAPKEPGEIKRQVQFRERSALAKFAARKNVALRVALTADQGRDADLVGQANAIVAFYRQQGRTVSSALGQIQPGGVVESLQPLRSPHRYPQWKTIASDLVVFGTPTNNVLIRDQLRGEIFPRDFSIPAAGEAVVICTRSPFVGECDVVNIVASDNNGIAAAVKAITMDSP